MRQMLIEKTVTSHQLLDLYGVFSRNPQLSIKPLWGENNIELDKSKVNLKFRMQNLEFV